MTIALRVFNHQSGNVWLDDIQLQQQKESATPEIATIGDERIGKHPIDIKQGGQFIEPLCSVLPSLIAQQVASTSFEDETSWKYSYRRLSISHIVPGIRTAACMLRRIPTIPIIHSMG